MASSLPSPPTAAATAFTTPKKSSNSPSTTSTNGGNKIDLEGVPEGYQFLDLISSHSTGEKIARGKSLQWNVHGPPSPHSLHLEDAPHQSLQRNLGSTESSYYLGARGGEGWKGVNDMYLHIGFRAPSSLMSPSSILSIWTSLTLSHQLLASEVEFREGDWDDIRFRYDPPKNGLEAKEKARERFECLTEVDPKVYLDTYLNGPRTLSDQILSKLVISTPSSSFSNGEEEQEYDFYLFSTHFLGDGMALHTTANEFFNLLQASFSKEQEKEEEMGELRELREVQTDEMARAMESKIDVGGGKWGKFAWAAARVAHQNGMEKDIGNHSFPRAKLGPRHTIVPTHSYTPEETSKILSICKSRKSTISHAVFALANLAYMRVQEKNGGTSEWPMMLYSALNVRGNLRKKEVMDWGEERGVGDWYHIAIGYYNIILPTLSPSTLTPRQIFWQRALSTRTQTSKIVKSPLLASRTLIMALEREQRSVGFEKADAEKAERERREKESKMDGLGISMAGLEVQEKKEEIKVEKKEVKVKTPSNALLGVSMLGNLDGMYTHAQFPSIKLHTLTTGSRQRPGAILLFAYTFAGKFWLSLGYDKNGFKEGVVEEWWGECKKGVREFLLEEDVEA